MPRICSSAPSLATARGGRPGRTINLRPRVHPACEITGAGGEAGRALAVDIVDREVEDSLFHLAGQVALFGKAEEAVDGIEAVLAVLAVVVVALEGDRAREAPHLAFPVANFHRGALPALGARLPGRLLRLHPAEHRLDAL